MHKVMIVDDEIAIREKLPKIIDFNAYGFEVCCTARNGRDALDKLPVFKPDLIFLDVRMPVMDGIRFLEEIKNTEFKDASIIILSGYSDFEYARKAVEFGVKAYMTKPIDEDEASVNLKSIGEMLDERKNRQESEKYNRDLNSLRKIYGTGNNACGFNDYSIIHIVLVSLKAEYENVYPYDVINSVMIDILKINSINGEFLLRGRGSVYSYLIPTNMVTDGFSHDIWEKLRKNKLNCVVMFDKGIFEKEEPFKQVFSERLHTMLTEVFYNLEIKTVFYRQTDNDAGSEIYASEERFISRLKQYLTELNKESIEAELEEFCDKIKELNLDMVYIQRINFRIYYVLLDIIKSSSNIDGTEAETLLSPPEWRDYATFINFGKWKLMQKQQIKDTIVFIEQCRTLTRMGVCGDVLEYVHLHFTEHITIKDVADTFHINSAYLGRIFQKATGINFKKYINNLRIQEAKRLLLQTDKLIYEIANESGFAESSYFISKFSNEVGISPSDFRKQ